MLHTLQVPTGRSEIVLRKLTIQDAQPLFELIDRNRDYLDRSGESTARMNTDIVAVISNIQNPLFSNQRRFCIWKGAELVGRMNIALRKEESADESTEILVGEVSYWVGSEYAGHGIATCALIGLTEYAFSTFSRMLATCGITRINNFASQKVLAKAGYIRQDGIRTDDYLLFTFANPAPPLR